MTPEITELESRKLAATEYIRLHDKRVVFLDRKPLDYLRNLYRADLKALGQELVYGGPVSRDEFVSAIIDLEFPDITTVRETYVNLMVG